MMWHNEIVEKLILSKKKKVVQALREERGAIFVLTALMLPVIFGFMGIAYDVGNVYVHKSRLQNVADAAALAGARAYLDSQNKTEEPKDSVDTSTSTDKSTTYEVGGGSKSRGLPHADADTAADEYIYKNIRNLGNKVEADRYSHYALNSAGDNLKTFYRIGLCEEVPLYFLPVVLKNKTKQTVRAGAVALVEQGATTVIPGGGVTIDPNSSFSIFDNLFTYSDTFHTRHTDHNNGDPNDHVITGFKGEMVYTHGSNSYSYFYTLQDHNLTQHYYTALGGYSGNAINDTVINTVYDTSAYVEAFQKKLLEPHVDLKDQVLNLVGNAEIRYSCESYIGQERVRKIGDEYYLLNANGDHLTLTYNNEIYDLCYRIMPPGEWNSPYVLCAKQRNITTTSETGSFNGGEGVRTKSVMKYYLLNSNKQVTNCFIEMTSTTIKYQYWTDGPHTSTNAYIEKDNVRYDLRYNNGMFVYGSSYLPIASIIEPNAEIAAPVEKSAISVVEHSGGGLSNVFHASKYFVSGEVPNLEIQINSEMTGTDPIFVIVDSDINLVKITGSASNNRPLILVYLGAGNIQFTSYTGNHFKGIIYAPYATIAPLNMQSGGQTYSGSIIVKNLDIEGTTDKTTFEKVNYLSDDVQVKAVADKIKESMEAANNRLTDAYLQQLADSFNGLSYTEGENGPTRTLNVTKDNLADMNWYNNLSYWEKQGLYQKWKTLYENETDPNKKDLIWLWSSIFKKSESGSDETVTEGGNLRLINYRTEYTESDSIVNPFRALSLERPYSY